MTLPYPFDSICQRVTTIGVALTLMAACQTEWAEEDYFEANQEAFSSGLPVVCVHTPYERGIWRKKQWKKGTTVRIYSPEKALLYEGSTDIKGRGNTSWHFPKKSYSMEFDEQSALLDMPEETHWCLLANWMDRTLMRNAVGFEVARTIGMRWAPRGRHVELIVNGQHRGNYYLCEQIRPSCHRLNLPTPTLTDNGKGGLTGGYILEIDNHYDADYRFRPTRSGLPWNFKRPSLVSEAQKKYVVAYVDSMEAALYSDARRARGEHMEYLDLDSWAEWMIAMELTMNSEIRHPRSCYIYKDRGGRLSAGPVWDFDWATLCPRDSHWSVTQDALYFPYLLKDERFRATLRQKWTEAAPRLKARIPAFIDSLQQELLISEERNTEMWPIGGERPNGDETLPFSQATERIKQAFLEKWEWLDTQFIIR